jgi:DNA-directed RNA polymerase specialized sigma24 family protein
VIDPRELAKQQKAAAKLAARKEKAAAVDVKSLKGAALARLDPAVLAHLSATQVKALTLTQLEGMSAEQLAAFTPEQIASMSKDMQAKFNALKTKKTKEVSESCSVQSLSDVLTSARWRDESTGSG